MKLIVLVSLFVMPCISFALQSINDEDLSYVSGQSGITIEITPETLSGEGLGTVATISEFIYTENDKDSSGAETFSLSDLKLKIVEFDANNDISGIGSFKADIDVANTGQVDIRSSNLPGLSLSVGDIKLGSRSIGSLDIDKWVFKPGSFLETSFVPDANGAKIRSRIFMTDGSFLNLNYKEDDLTLTSTVNFLPNSSNNPFDSESFISGIDGVLRLELGQTTGTLEITNIKLRDENSVELFGGQSFGDIGLGDVVINEGYFELTANPDSAVEGLLGEFGSDLTIGEVFYRTNGQRININNIKLKTGDFNGALDPIGYTFELVGGVNSYGNGVALTFFDVDNLNFEFSAFTFSSDDGSNETVSFGSLGIANASFGSNGQLTQSIWALPGSGEQGLRLDLQVTDGVRFDLTIKEDPVVNNTPTLTAETVINTLTFETYVDFIEKGLHVNVIDFELDANINSIKLGTNDAYKGQTGRVVVDNYTVEPGSYIRFEPLQ